MTDETADRRLFLLGGIVDTFAAIELRAQVLLAGFALQEIVGEILAADLGFQAITQKLALLSKLPGLERAGDSLADWTRRAADVSDRRNRVVHSFWYLHDLDDPDSGARFKLSARGKPSAVQDVFRNKPETTEELEVHLDEMNMVAVEAAGLAEVLRETGKWNGSRIP
jgi:hypothetical protein